MAINKAYNSWADSYDAIENKTRDLERIVSRKILNNYNFETVIELGCGTGKNTEWLIKKAKSVLALDFSEEMLKKAKAKIKSKKVQFEQADLTKAWKVENNYANLISCSLTLEHIFNLDFVFKEASKKLKKEGKFFICELHSFKQYQGSKAKFVNKNETVKINAFVHNISDYIEAATNNNFKLLELKEWFDNEDKTKIPRLVSFVFEK